MMFEPQKGKDLDSLSQATANSFDRDEFLFSTKYDGNQIWIIKWKDEMKFFTSNWKQFDIPHLHAELLKNVNTNFILKAEFMYGCEGKLGDRRKSAILTTWRTNFSKSLTSYYDKDKVNIKVFDCLVLDDNKLLQTKERAEDRLLVARLLHLPVGVDVIATRRLTGKQAKIEAAKLANAGWEGGMCIAPDSVYQIGKRVNYIIKLKFRKTADLLCIDVEAGEGKCEGIGALVLQDSEGRIVRVGSGLDYAGDTRDGSKFIGKIIEIEYEQIMETYIQPVFKCIRPDKLVKDIS